MQQVNIVNKTKSFGNKYIKLVVVFLWINVFLNSNTFAQQWSMLGNESQIATAATAFTTITVIGDEPYVAFVEGASPNGTGKVKKRNAATGLWEQVGGNIATNISFTRIYHDNNNQLYLTYIDIANGSKLAVVTFNAVTQTWQPLSTGNLYVSIGTVTHAVSAFNTAPRSSLSFDSNNQPYITFSERSSTYNYNAYVKTFVAGTWQTVGTAAVSVDIAIANNIIIDNNDVPFLVYIQQGTATNATGVLKTFKFDVLTNLWVDISPVSPVAGGSATTGATTSVRHSSIAIDSANNIIVTYFNTSNSNKSTALRFNQITDTWSYIGTNGTRDAPNNSLVNDIGNVYNSFADALTNGGTMNMLRVYKLYSGATFFTELRSAGSNRGIDSIGTSDFNLAIGSDTSKPFIVYTKPNASSIRTPIVQTFQNLINTSAATSITATSATVGGEVVNDGGFAIVERGIVYGATANPTTTNTKVVDAATTLGIFSTYLTTLTSASTYHVRAYIITSAGTFYGRNVAFTTLAPSPNSVTLQDNGSTVVLNNGIVKATITKSNAAVTSLVYNGIEMITGGYNGGQLYWSWNMPNYQNPSGCTYTLTANPQTNNFDYAEIKLRQTWNTSASTAAMDVDIYYSLPKNASGLYAAATLSHPTNYPAMPGGEWRMAGYPNPRFNWLSVDSLRNKTMPSASDMSNAVAVTNAPPEVSRITTGPYTNYYECKYDYSADFGDIDCWGWSSTTDNVGLWITAPSKEYYPGGPKKRELLVHGTPVILNMLGGTHYGTGNETSVAAGEDWKKTYGPFLIYCNKVAPATPNAPIALWNDAKAQALTEQAAWPYSWFTNTDYRLTIGRGTVTGTLLINDIVSQPAANTWVGLAIPPTGTGSQTDFQRWSKNYQFWTKTDAAGNFTIPNVRVGTYNLYAFGSSAIGQLSVFNAATVTAATTTALGNVTWTPARVAPTVWQIGIPDRSAGEFFHGNDWWVGNYYPNPNWAKFMDYTTEFPNDVNIFLDTTNIATNWNYVQPYNKNVQTTSPKWDVNFKLTTAPTTGSTASVYVALAANFSAALIMTVNGTNVTVPTTGATFGSNSNAMIRMGIHGAFAETRINFPASYLQAGDNEISFTLRVTGGATSGEVMYDYVRLEATGTSLISLPVKFTSITAYSLNEGIQVDWKVASEIDIQHYEIEKSKDAINFVKVGTVNARAISGAILYKWYDAFPYENNNYYRIKSVGLNGQTEISKIVKVNLKSKNSAIVIYPSPITNNHFNLQLNNVAKGNYQLKLHNNLGQKIWEQNILHTGGTATKTINIGNNFPKGIYTAELKSNNNTYQQLIIIK